MASPESRDNRRSDSAAAMVVVKKKKQSESGFAWLVTPRLACFGIKPEPEEEKEGSFDMEVNESFRSKNPDHLVFMVNGLSGSSQDWKFAAKQFLKRFPDDVVVHCSGSNSAMLTFDGVDITGERLAEEVISVVKNHPSVRKISFVAHSLGGLIARYAIAMLFERDITKEAPLKGEEDLRTNGSDNPCSEESFKGKIAGLEPVNFITFASPHLGISGHKQVPVFCGLYSLESLAARTSWFLGKSGTHLFLTDSDSEKPPLLLQMARDCENLKFISALQSFKRRVAYANVRFDPLVGWSTSSLRRRDELPKLKKKSQDEKYPHIVNVEPARVDSLQKEVSTESKAGSSNSTDFEDEMLKNLTRLSWERIDVSFHGSTQRFLAHNTIQVKGSWINSDGADVIQHLIDNFLL